MALPNHRTPLAWALAGFAAVLAVTLLPLAAIAARDLDLVAEPGVAPQQMPDNSKGDGQDPEIAAPEPDEPSEDGTPSQEDSAPMPPGGCPFNNGPLELIV
jgi:hypothetical protein